MTDRLWMRFYSMNNESQPVPSKAIASPVPNIPFRLWHIVLLAALWVITLWGFWTHGVYAWGVNASLFLLLLLFFFDSARPQKVFFCRRYWQWHVPAFAVIASFMVYENPFLKSCNLLALPLLCGFLICHRSLEKPDLIFCRPMYLVMLTFGWLVAPLRSLGASILQHFALLGRITGRLEYLENARMKSVLKGVIILVLLSLFVIIPLLSSADTDFSSYFTKIARNLEAWIESLFEMNIMLRVLCWPFISIFVLSTFLTWNKPAAIPENKSNAQDSISAGIVLGGILLIYGLFIWIQLARLWLDTLPLTFKDTESYVKSGFWQLVTLSALNIYLVMLYFRRTSIEVQYILAAFLVASLLLLCSAAHRVFFYAMLYGLSHEKLYASYTVIYCLIIFVLIIGAFILKRDLNIVKVSVWLLLWMYGLLNLLPCEYIIARSSLALSKRSDTRIHLFDLQMLSSDALPFIDTHREELTYSVYATPWRNVDRWVALQKHHLGELSWYEYTVSSLLARLRSDSILHVARTRTP